MDTHYTSRILFTEIKGSDGGKKEIVRDWVCTNETSYLLRNISAVVCTVVKYCKTLNSLFKNESDLPLRPEDWGLWVTVGLMLTLFPLMFITGYLTVYFCGTYFKPIKPTARY